MPKIFSIFFLVVFYLPVSSLYFSLKVQQRYIQQESQVQIEAGVNKAQLVLLKITRALKDNLGTAFKHMHVREFRYKGRMYDDVRLEVRGDTTWYWCVWDEEETKLTGNAM